MTRYQLQTPKRPAAKPVEERITELERKVLSTSKLLRKSRAELESMEARIAALEAAQSPAPSYTVKTGITGDNQRVSVIAPAPAPTPQLKPVILVGQEAITDYMNIAEALRDYADEYHVDWSLIDRFDAATERLLLFLSAPAPTPETVTISKAEWDATQERIGNAINALNDIAQIAYDARPSARSEIAELCSDALDRDLKFEVALGA